MKIKAQLLIRGHHILKSNYWCFQFLCFFKTYRSSLLCVSPLVTHIASLQWNCPSLILFMFNSLYFWTLFKYTRTFNLPMQNASHSRFVSPARLNGVVTIPSCRSLAETWNTNILKSKSRRNPLVVLPLCSSGWHQSIDCGLF